MILALDNETGLIKIGSPPEDLPGIVESIRIDGALLIEKAQVAGQSGKIKIVRGWDDVDLSIKISLIDDPQAELTRWDFLKQIVDTFRKVSTYGKPEVFVLSHPMTNAWRSTRFLFSSLNAAENRAKRKITASLDFVEYESFSGVVQQRQNEPQKARSTGYVPPTVSDKQRRGLGSLEKRFG